MRHERRKQGHRRAQRQRAEGVDRLFLEVGHGSTRRNTRAGSRWTIASSMLRDAGSSWTLGSRRHRHTNLFGISCPISSRLVGGSAWPSAPYRAGGRRYQKPCTARPRYCRQGIANPLRFIWRRADVEHIDRAGAREASGPPSIRLAQRTGFVRGSGWHGVHGRRFHPSISAVGGVRK